MFPTEQFHSLVMRNVFKPSSCIPNPISSLADKSSFFDEDATTFYPIKISSFQQHVISENEEDEEEF